MRLTEGTPTIRRRAMIAVVLTLLVSLVVPAMAAAVTTPRSTLRTSTRLQTKAKRFVISGRVSSRYKGKTMTIEIRKPGRKFWDKVATVKIDKTGKWSYGYTPKLGGKFYIRARYGSSGNLSRTATLTVRRGPGVKTVIRLASTTSTKDSGLFEALVPVFARTCPEYNLQATFVGSGPAMALGGKGDADVLLVHSPADEVQLMNGYYLGALQPYKGLRRYKVMYNYYVLVGPKTNPAGVALGSGAKSAFGTIATYNNASGSPSDFYSRKDNSGTNARELEVWSSLGNPQTGKAWYKASKMGMAEALNASQNTSGYTLSDEATWFNLKGALTNLKVVDESKTDSTYFNQYSVIEMAKARNQEGAQDFSNWIRSPDAQAIINGYGIHSSAGRATFTANPGSW